MALEVHIWSDIVCPWCFIGKRRFEAAVEKFGEPVAVTWHSFELDPTRKKSPGLRLAEAERLAKKYGMSVERARAMISQMQSVGAKEGIAFRPEGGNTETSFDAHRVLHYAKSAGMQDALKERLFRAQWCEGVDLGDANELIRVAGEIGLDIERVSAVVHSDEFAAAVREDEQAARELGINGVPFYVIGRYGVSGAQASDVFLQALDRAFVEEDAAVPEGEACLPGEC